MSRNMNYLMKLSYLFVFSVLIASCSKDDNPSPTEPTGDFNFTISKHNSKDSFVSKVKSTEFQSRYMSWGRNSDGSIHITKNTVYNVTLENGISMQFDIFIRKESEDSLKLVLTGENTFLREWRYKYKDDEFNNFYKGFDDARISNGGTVIFYSSHGDGFEVKRLYDVSVNGKLERRPLIKFSGQMNGWFDPNGEFMECYRIKNGSFLGVL
jgi:hypothetical protein